MKRRRAATSLQQPDREGEAIRRVVVAERLRLRERADPEEGRDVGRAARALAVVRGPVRGERRAVLGVAVLEPSVRAAVLVCALFNTIDRIADALGFEVPPDEQQRAVAPLLLEMGYSSGAKP